MNLEDHLGDVVRKARAMSNVSPADAAPAAGLSEPALAALEDSGQVQGSPNFDALGQLLGLNPAKLKKLAAGWKPSEKDLSLWREFRCITTTGQGITVNCYLVWDEVSREAALFDTGWEAGPILQLIHENQLVLRHLFITHTHEDHIAALSQIREAFPKVRLHSNSKTAPMDQRNRKNDFIHLEIATRRATPRTAPPTSSVLGQRTHRMLLLSGMPSSPAPSGAATNRGTWPKLKSASKSSVCPQKPSSALAMDR
jgi:hypothetical protein